MSQESTSLLGVLADIATKRLEKENFSSGIQAENSVRPYNEVDICGDTEVHEMKDHLLQNLFGVQKEKLHIARDMLLSLSDTSVTTTSQTVVKQERFESADDSLQLYHHLASQRYFPLHRNVETKVANKCQEYAFAPFSSLLPGSEVADVHTTTTWPDIKVIDVSKKVGPDDRSNHDVGPSTSLTDASGSSNIPDDPDAIFAQPKPITKKFGVAGKKRAYKSSASGGPCKKQQLVANKEEEAVIVEPQVIYLPGPPYTTYAVVLDAQPSGSCKWQQKDLSLYNGCSTTESAGSVSARAFRTASNETVPSGDTLSSSQSSKPHGAKHQVVAGLSVVSAWRPSRSISGTSSWWIQDHNYALPSYMADFVPTKQEQHLPSKTYTHSTIAVTPAQSNSKPIKQAGKNVKGKRLKVSLEKGTFNTNETRLTCIGDQMESGSLAKIMTQTAIYAIEEKQHQYSLSTPLPLVRVVDSPYVKIAPKSSKPRDKSGQTSDPNVSGLPNSTKTVAKPSLTNPANSQEKSLALKYIKEFRQSSKRCSQCVEDIDGPNNKTPPQPISRILSQQLGVKHQQQQSSTNTGPADQAQTCADQGHDTDQPSDDNHPLPTESGVSLSDGDRDNDDGDNKGETTPAPESVQKKKRVLSCALCPHKQFTASASLLSHYRSHAGIKPYICTDCGDCFTRQHSLNYHMLIHLNASRFSCETCGRRFRHPSHFKEHLRKHTGETPYTCTQCSTSFKTRNTYKRHLKARHYMLLTVEGIRNMTPQEILTMENASSTNTNNSPLPLTIVNGT